MAKVYVQNFNIYNPVKYSIENASSTARSAQNISYDIPNGFGYANYIRGLSDKFRNTRNKLNAIDSRISLVERKLTELVDAEENRISLLNDAKVIENNKI